jgi:hypothetical protein
MRHEKLLEEQMNLKMAATAAAVLAATAMTASPVLASTNAKAQPVTIQTRGVGKTYLNAASGDWTHCTYVTKAKYAQNAGCSKGKTVSESISGNAGYSVEDISAGVGFNVSFSQSVSSSNAVTVLPGGYGWYDVGFRYKRYRIGMEHRTCAGRCTKCPVPTG